MERCGHEAVVPETVFKHTGIGETLLLEQSGRFLPKSAVNFHI